MVVAAKHGRDMNSRLKADNIVGERKGLIIVKETARNGGDDEQGDDEDEDDDYDVVHDSEIRRGNSENVVRSDVNIRRGEDYVGHDSSVRRDQPSNSRRPNDSVRVQAMVGRKADAINKKKYDENSNYFGNEIDEKDEELRRINFMAQERARRLREQTKKREEELLKLRMRKQFLVEANKIQSHRPAMNGVGDEKVADTRHSETRREKVNVKKPGHLLKRTHALNNNEIPIDDDTHTADRHQDNDDGDDRFPARNVPVGKNFANFPGSNDDSNFLIRNGDPPDHILAMRPQHQTRYSQDGIAEKVLPEGFDSVVASLRKSRDGKRSFGRRNVLGVPGNNKSKAILSTPMESQSQLVVHDQSNVPVKTNLTYLIKDSRVKDAPHIGEKKLGYGIDVQSGNFKRNASSLASKILKFGNKVTISASETRTIENRFHNPAQSDNSSKVNELAKEHEVHASTSVPFLSTESLPTTESEESRWQRIEYNGLNRDEENDTLQNHSPEISNLTRSHPSRSGQNYGAGSEPGGLYLVHNVPRMDDNRAYQRDKKPVRSSKFFSPVGTPEKRFKSSRAQGSRKIGAKSRIENQSLKESSPVNLSGIVRSREVLPADKSRPVNRSGTVHPIESMPTEESHRVNRRGTVRPIDRMISRQETSSEDVKKSVVAVAASASIGPTLKKRGEANSKSPSQMTRDFKSGAGSEVQLVDKKLEQAVHAPSPEVAIRRTERKGEKSKFTGEAADKAGGDMQLTKKITWTQQ
ncbi:uncharacterized protein LOC108665180 isoform X4 [Hyalella azteca]|uniref:Uncharacterized protein LOC108665180 isoform X4 n=1 Tax=Hyalella azteca TaxID=294128 RepID=A0A979FMV7_HYAAZ|nr:uncharacterized protein LOC108665180 isoform X4 [Hyalella azteca]